MLIQFFLALSFAFLFVHERAGEIPQAVHRLMEPISAEPETHLFCAIGHIRTTGSSF